MRRDEDRSDGRKVRMGADIARGGAAGFAVGVGFVKLVSPTSICPLFCFHLFFSATLFIYIYVHK